MLVLCGLLVVVVGFAFRVNPLLVVTVAGIVTGLAGGLGFLKTLGTLGHAFTESRYVAIVWLVLPVIGLLERAGLKERARDVVMRMQAATTGRVLLAYLALRQITAALGLVSLGGHPQMVRPLIAPMAEAAAEASHGPLSDKNRYRVRSFAAATDNIGLFFGEDFFVAIGSILLIVGFLEQSGIKVAPAELAVWALPTAGAAFLIHATRLILFERSLGRAPKAPPADTAPASGAGQ